MDTVGLESTTKTSNAWNEAKIRVQSIFAPCHIDAHGAVYFNWFAVGAQQFRAGLQETFMNNGLLFLGAVLIVVLSTLFAAPNFIDWNSYRGVFEEEASKVLGREVRVGGSVNLKFLPSPYVRFEKVRIANVSGQTGEPFVRADSFTMWLSGPALLRGVLEASQIELEKPVLTLAVDKSGTGNWSDIKLLSADLPFAPRDVTLRSVKLSDGAISIFNATAERIATIDNINGELSADGLKGPFRFKGAASWAGAAHDLAFATEQPAADGSFGLKISARSEGSPTNYLLDGRVSDLDSKPTFNGEWTGQIAMSDEDATTPDGKDEASRLDLKAKVSADALGAKFDDLTLSLDNVAEPQMITGSAAATWTTPPHLDLALTSKWLDIDRLAGAGQGSASFSKLKQLTLDLVQSVAGDSKASARIKLEQVKVGGETAGGLNIDAERNGKVTHIKEFNVSLPGGSRLDLSGDLTNLGDGKHHFSGSLFVGGTSLARLKSWAGKSGMPIDITSDGPFSLTGKLDIDQTQLSISDASGQISGRALAGDLTISQGSKKKRTDLTLQAADLDTREIFPTTADALEASLRKALGVAPSNANPTEPAPQELPGDMQVRVIAGRLTDGHNVYRDVDVTFETEGKTFRLPAAKLTTEKGLKVSLEGRVKTLDSGPSGTLAYDIVAPTADAAGDFMSRIGLAPLFGGETFKGLQSAKLAGLIELGRRTPSASDITFDGTLNDSRFKGAAEFDAGLASWRSRPSRVHATVGSPSLANLLALFGRDRIEAAGDSSAPAEASLITAGTLGTDAKTRFEIAGQGLDVAFDGTAVWPENAPLALNGAVNVKAEDFAEALAIAGLRVPAGASGTSVQGHLDLARDKDVWTVTTRDLHLGTSSLAAYLQVATGSDGRHRIEGKLGADRVSITPLLAMLTDKPASLPVGSDGIDAGADAVAETHPIWPSGVFNFSALGDTDADVRVSFASLDLSGNLATRDGELRLVLMPGKVAVSELSAQAAGGRLTGALSLEKGASGVALATDLKLDHVNLATLSPSSKGLATFEIKGGGTAQSPAGLIAVMSGSGAIGVQGASVHGPTASAAAEIADAVLDGKMQNDLRTISSALLTSLNTSSIAIGDRQFPIAIDGGSVKLDTIGFESPDGKVEATVAVDLTSLGVSAACQVSALVKPPPPPSVPLPKWQPPPPKGPLPPAVVLYEGPLDNLPVIKSSVDVGDFQRELSVRQVERNVQELEQSRRVDEERARLDRQRRKALDAQRASTTKKDSEVLPPVIPESAGTADGSTGEALPSETPPDAQTAPDPSVPAPPVIQENSAAPIGAVSAGAVQTPTITVEPIPAPPSDVAVDASTEQPVAARSTAVSRPRTPVRRRTSSDEVMRSLGNMQ